MSDGDKMLRAETAKLGEELLRLKRERDALREEADRLRKALRYEENRFARQGTHGPGCWSWGPGHYECALREIERVKAERANAMDALRVNTRRWVPELSYEEIDAKIRRICEVPK